MVHAAEFCQRLVESYEECRAQFESPTAWQEVWTSHWSRFVLWNPVPPQTRPLMRVVADKLGLQWWDREPFRLDGAMVPIDSRPIGNYPLPFLVGVEHENDLRTFIDEIVKLAHVVCPLEVAITYALAGVVPAQPEAIHAAQHQITRLVTGALADREKFVKEGPATEYLYLLGAESRVRELDWYPWHFSIRTGPSSSGGSRLEGFPEAVHGAV